MDKTSRGGVIIERLHTMNKFKGIKCPKCNKRGIRYADHPHAYGFKNYNRVSCRYCNSFFNSKPFEIYVEKANAEKSIKSDEGTL